MTAASLKALLSDGLRRDGLWAVGFIGVCVMVALGHLKPETIEFMLFALLGKQSERGSKKEEE